MAYGMQEKKVSFWACRVLLFLASYCRVRRVHFATLLELPCALLPSAFRHLRPIRLGVLLSLPGRLLRFTFLLAKAFLLVSKYDTWVNMHQVYSNFFNVLVNVLVVLIDVPTNCIVDVVNALLDQHVFFR